MLLPSHRRIITLTPISTPLHHTHTHTHRHAQRLRPDVEGILAASVVVVSAAARDLTCARPAASPSAPTLA